MILAQAFAFLALHAVPKSVLRRWLCRKLSRGLFRFEPQFSGRVSLFLLARRLLLRARSDVALVPDYVCNIAPKVFRLAGWEVVAYPTDRDLEPDWEGLLLLLDTRKAGVLVGASVFGSSGLLTFLSEAEKLVALRHRSVQVVIDMAQDVRLVDLLPPAGADFVHGILSFNDKSFPGSMGGGILSSAPAEGEQMKHLSVSQVAHLYRRLLVKLYRACRTFIASSPVRAASEVPSHDYSSCGSFPHEIEGSCYEPAKIQYVLALIGLRDLPHYGLRKVALLQHGLHLKTRFASTAAYLIMDEDWQQSLGQIAARRARKSPYAAEGTPDCGLRSNDIIFHNKGFLDGT
ncbi:MAG: hypothetical protein ACREDM_02610 [Methylocella sp.]